MPSPRDISVYLMLVLMELLAGFAVIVGSSLLDATSLGYGMFWPLLASAVAGLGVGLAVATIGPRKPWNRVILVAGAAVSATILGLLASRHPVSFLVAVFLLGFMYWRGLSLSQEAPSAAEVQGRFGFGFAILFVGLLWVLARGILYNHAIWHMLAIIGIAYTVTAMIALVTARVEQRREPGSGLAIVLAVSVQLGLLIVVSLAALQLFAFDLTGGVWQFSHPIWDAIGATLLRTISVLSAPIGWLISLVRPVHSQGRTITFVPPNTGRGTGTPVPPHRPSGNPLVVVVALVFALLVLAGVGFLIWKAIPRISRYHPERGFVEQRSSLLSLRDVWQACLAWLRSIFAGSAAAAEAIVRRTKRRVFGEFPDDPVRRVYAQMLRRSAAAGLIRLPARTPDEFHAELALRWPDGTHHFAALTEAYVLRRYGEIELTDDELQRLRRHWQGVRTMMRVSRRPQRDPAVGDALISEIGDIKRQWLRPIGRLRWESRDPLIGGSDRGWGRNALLLAVCVIAPILCVVVFLIVLSTLGAHSGLSVNWMGA